MITGQELPKKIAVLMGGPGSEREVSLATGRGVSKALRSLGAEVVEIDVRSEDFQLPRDVDLAFNTIHGTFGEDGQLQRILDRRGIAYTGDGVSGSEIAFDKIHTKQKFQEHGITTPPWEVIHPGAAAYNSVADRREGATARLNGGRNHCKERKRNRFRHP